MINFSTQSDFGAISPMMEMGAYEWLWQQDIADKKPSFKNLAELFRQHPDSFPSELVPFESAEACAAEVLSKFNKRGVGSFSVRVRGSSEFPDFLLDAEHPVQFLYYRGNWELVYTPVRVAIVGTREPSHEGERRTAKLASMLATRGVTVVSGLAKGIDTIAHQAAIRHGGNTIAVIGTPLDQVYPRENSELQELIARKHLLISQVPVLQYAKRPPSVNRFFFPERNITMSALSQATIIVEAGETSGTLIQARAALKQGRKLFILESNFDNPSLTWPHRYEKLGAIRVREFEDILKHLDVDQAIQN